MKESGRAKYTYSNRHGLLTEPVMLCLMSAIETGVIFLINDGIDRGLWDLQNKNDVKNDILVKYRQMSVPPES
jgi:curli production assembly/transport component CsgG